MAKKGKMKISKVKRNNHTTNKMKKQGKLKLQRHRKKEQKQRPPATTPSQLPGDSDSESSAGGDDWADMLDDAEREYMERRLARQPQLLASVPTEEEHQQTNSSKPRKRARAKAISHSDSGAESGAPSDSEAEFETRYEDDLAAQPAKKLRQLLPIKTKTGLQMQTEECDESNSDHGEEEPPTKKLRQADEEVSGDSDSGLEGADDEIIGDDLSEGGVINTVQLLVARRERLKKDKTRLGALCSSLLEEPEKKLKNLYPILFLMEEKLKDGSENLMSVRKLATLSAFEVFKDLLPEYSIQHQDYSNVKLKKDTLALYKYEKELLEFYKRYLQRLEKAMAVLNQKKGDTRRVDEGALELGFVSLECMCGLLASRPRFNFAENVARAALPALAGPRPRARAAAAAAAADAFRHDRKGDVTLSLVRCIDRLVKKRGARLPPAALDCLLHLNVGDVSLDADADLRRKQKKDEKRKKRIINLSKKEKKRAKRLREVERELLETEAQESSAQRNRLMTEVTETLFHIYFRILKRAPHSKLLAAALNGLAKFIHAINVEYYSDLVAILARLVEDEALRDGERLLCVRTVLAALAARGDALALDPARFHAALLRAAPRVHAGAAADDARLVVECALQTAARARRVAADVLTALAARLAAMAAALPPHSALAALAALHRLAQQSKAVLSLLERAAEGGEEEGGAGAAGGPAGALCALRRHHHPALRAAAAALLRAPHALPPALANASPLRLLDEYDGSRMAFVPGVPPPAAPPAPPAAPRRAAAAHAWAQPDLRDRCFDVERDVSVGDVTFKINRINKI